MPIREWTVYECNDCENRFDETEVRMCGLEPRCPHCLGEDVSEFTDQEEGLE